MEKYMINTERFVVREIDDNIVILDVDNGDFISTDGVGKLIISLIENNTIDDIVNEIKKQFDLTEKYDVKNDVEQFVMKLKEKNIIETAI